MLRNLLVLSFATIAGVVFAQTLTSITQIRPSSGPSTALVVTVGTKAMWADLGPGLAVDVLPTGRAMIRAVPQGTHAHSVGVTPALAWEEPRTCFSAPVGIGALAVYLNGTRMEVTEDFVAVGAGKYCFIAHYGNLLVATEGKNRVSLDYVSVP